MRKVKQHIRKNKKLYAGFLGGVTVGAIMMTRKGRQMDDFIMHIGLTDEWDEYKKTGKDWA